MGAIDHIYGLSSVAGLAFAGIELIRLRRAVTASVKGAQRQQVSLAMVDSAHLFQLAVERIERAVDSDPSGKWCKSEIDRLRSDLSRARRLNADSDVSLDLSLAKALTTTTRLAVASTDAIDAGVRPHEATQQLRGFLRGGGAEVLADVQTILTAPKRQRG